MLPEGGEVVHVWAELLMCLRAGMFSFSFFFLSLSVFISCPIFLSCAGFEAKRRKKRSNKKEGPGKRGEFGVGTSDRGAPGGRGSQGGGVGETSEPGGHLGVVGFLFLYFFSRKPDVLYENSNLILSTMRHHGSLCSST